MRLDPRLEQYRFRTGSYRSLKGSPYGAFIVPGPSARSLTIIADDGATTGWEHVSVSTSKHAPNWREMCFVKSLFWEPNDVVVQYHPAERNYINCHPNCLHMWRWLKGDFPTPPLALI